MDGEVEEGRMIVNERKMILNIAYIECDKKVAKLNKKINSLSDKLAKLDDSNSTVKARASQRATLSIECAERDRWLYRIDIINKWMKEIE